MNDFQEDPGVETVRNKSQTCDQCGRFDAVQLHDRWLCLDCYAACGSCCAGEFMEISPEKPDENGPKTDIDTAG